MLVDAGTTAPAPAPARDARLDAMLEEVDRVDWRNTVFGLRTPNPPSPARARLVPSHGRWRLDAVASVRAYHYLGSLSGDAYATGDIFADSPRFPFTNDGRLDDRVLPPDAELTADEQRRVLALLGQPASGARPISMCDFDPHHVLVFFDAAGAPIGRLAVCFTCDELQALPGLAPLGGDRPAGMADAERAMLKEILDAHGLGAWMYDDADAEALAAYARRIDAADSAATPAGLARRARLDALPSGVAQDVLASRASPDERRRQCVWLDAELWRRRGQHCVYGGYRCDDGSVYFLNRDTMAACETKRLCDVPMRRVEACLRAKFLDGPDRACGADTAPECEGLMTCLPGVDWQAHGR